MNRVWMVVSLGLAACGASSSSQNISRANTASAGTADGAGSGSDVVCREEKSTGSSISHQVCRSKFQSEQDQKGAQNMLGTPATAAGRPGN